MLTIRNWFSKRVRTLVMTLSALALAAIPVGTAEPAFATGGGCTHYYTSLWCFKVEGNGTHVSNTRSEAITDRVSNYQVLVRFWDFNNRNYASYAGPIHYGVTYGGFVQNMVSGNFRPGVACGTLKSSGTELATACVQIY